MNELTQQELGIIVMWLSYAAGHTKSLHERNQIRALVRKLGIEDGFEENLSIIISDIQADGGCALPQFEVLH